MCELSVSVGLGSNSAMIKNASIDWETTGTIGITVSPWINYQAHAAMGGFIVNGNYTPSGMGSINYCSHGLETGGGVCAIPNTVTSCSASINPASITLKDTEGNTKSVALNVVCKGNGGSSSGSGGGGTIVQPGTGSITDPTAK